VLSPCDSKSIVSVIREANAAGIPVFTVDTPCNEPGVVIAMQVATDNEEGGREAGQAMIEALAASEAASGAVAGGKIAVLHFKQAESCQLRVKGFHAVIDARNASAAAAVKIDIVTELESNAAKDIGFTALEAALQAIPDKMGVQIVEAILRWSRGETLPPQMLIPTSLYRKADTDKDPTRAPETSRRAKITPAGFGFSS
jgi:ribose transport system substrate-binding protein